MRRDQHSKALVFPLDPNKKVLKDQRNKVIHHSDEIQFLADCINYQQGIIEKQDKTIELLTRLSELTRSEEVKGSKSAKPSK